MPTITSEYTGRTPNGSVILSPDLVGTIEITDRHANRATEERLTAFFRDCWDREPTKGGTVNMGRRSYIFDGEHWRLIKPEPAPPKPAQNAAVLTLDRHKFSNGENFLLFRFPTNVNWHKKIVPALGRLYRRLTGKAMHHGDNACVFPIMEAGDPAEFFAVSKYPVRYDYVDGEFVELPLNNPSKKSDDTGE